MNASCRWWRDGVAEPSLSAVRSTYPKGAPGGRRGARRRCAVHRRCREIDAVQSRASAHAARRARRARHGERLLRPRRQRYPRFEFPVGTQIFDAHTGELRFDIREAGQREVVARGGRGRAGQHGFRDPLRSRSAARRAWRRRRNEDLRLELKVLADVGILGFPNAGKSTFIRAVSRAPPPRSPTIRSPR